jgi:two-component system sensor histidine kinase KdpD
MWRAQGRQWRHSLLIAVVGSASVGALTLLGYRLHLDFASISPLYLLIIVLLSLLGDFLPAAAISVVAVGCLDYFFVEPIFTFGVADPHNLLALVSFLATALVITQLVSRVRKEAKDSTLQKERINHLYQVAQQLLALEPEVADGEQFLKPFAGVFGAGAVCFFDASAAELHSVGYSRSELEARTRAAYLRGRDEDDPVAGVTIRCFRVAGRTTGAMGFEGLENPELTAGPLTSLAAAFQERTIAFRHATEAIAAAQTEVYRSAILDALAHEFKTPLATVLAAAGGMREAGPLNQDQSEMADTVETETARLGSLTSRLLRLARLDREEVKPQMELTEVGPLVAQLVRHYQRPPSDRRISFVNGGEQFEALADPELLRLAVSQLLDNACKYSLPGSAVTVDMHRQNDLIAVCVSNTGSSIRSGDRPHIFERFYRGIETRQFTPGSGLGLYIARKIALAHGGDLHLDLERSGNDGVTFCLSIPPGEGAIEQAAGLIK